MAAPVWMTSSEACKYLGLTLRTLYRVIDQGELVGYRFGRVIRLKQDGVVDGMDAVVTHLAREPPSKRCHLP